MAFQIRLSDALHIRPGNRQQAIAGLLAQFATAAALIQVEVLFGFARRRARTIHRLLTVTWSDVQRVAETYLKGQDGSRAVVAPRGTASVAEKLGLGVVDY